MITNYLTLVELHTLVAKFVVHGRYLLKIASYTPLRHGD